MPEYFYMQPLWAYENGTLTTIDQGAVTRRPIEAYRRYTLKSEAEMRRLDEEWAEKRGTCVPERRSREGRMFATWRFVFKPTAAEAQERVKASRPHRVYVATSNYYWSFAPFVLPDDVTIRF